jgi:ribosome-binding factor A
MLREVRDPRLIGVNITDVEVDRELAYAKVFVSTLEGKTRSQEVLEGLESAKGFIRHTLAQRIQLRSFPRLRFEYDPTFENAERIEQLIASLNIDSNPMNDSNGFTEDGYSQTKNQTSDEDASVN